MHIFKYSSLFAKHLTKISQPISICQEATLNPRWTVSLMFFLLLLKQGYLIKDSLLYALWVQIVVLLKYKKYFYFSL